MIAKELNLKVPVGSGNKYKFTIDILSSIVAPFNQLRPKEKELFAWLLYYNNQYPDISEVDRYTLIMSKKKEISDSMGISMDNFYNIVMNLKKKNLLLETGINPRYVIKDIDKIIFTLT
jgi:hypothetical protein